MMLTRASTAIEWSEMSDEDWDRIVNMTEEERAAEDAEFDRECATFEREHRQRLARLSVAQRYKYERRLLLTSLLRCRVRIDKYRREAMFDFLVEKERALLKSRQTELLDWRRYKITGQLPGGRA
jgi:hypothetical protein